LFSIDEIRWCYPEEKGGKLVSAGRISSEKRKQKNSINLRRAEHLELKRGKLGGVVQGQDGADAQEIFQKKKAVDGTRGDYT